MKSTITKLAASAVLAASATLTTATPVQAGGNPYIGELMIFAGNFCPRNWVPAQGQLLKINDHQALFAILGTVYGGDGRTTFGLPDMRGRVPIGIGTGPGLQAVREGQKGGSSTAKLKEANMPVHNHGVDVDVKVDVTSTLRGTTDAAITIDPDDSLLAFTDGSIIYGTASKIVSMHNKAIRSATSVNKKVTQENRGAGQPFSIMQPSIGTRYCISIQGLFPQR